MYADIRSLLLTAALLHRRQSQLPHGCYRLHGGQHRSVYFARKACAPLRAEQQVLLRHRELAGSQ